MVWARMLAYVTGAINQELLLKNEYLVAENRILKAKVKGRLVLSAGEKTTLAEIARRHGASAAQIALTWLVRQEGTIVIPKAARAEHVRDNNAALKIALTEEDLGALDRAFPPPKGKSALGML